MAVPSSPTVSALAIRARNFATWTAASGASLATSGVTINWPVSSGSATLSAPTSVTSGAGRGLAFGLRLEF